MPLVPVLLASVYRHYTETTGGNTEHESPYRSTANGNTSASSVRCALQTPSILFSSSLSPPKSGGGLQGFVMFLQKKVGGTCPSAVILENPASRLVLFSSPLWGARVPCPLLCRRAFTKAALRNGPPSLASTNFFHIGGKLYHVHEKMVGKN